MKKFILIFTILILLSPLILEAYENYNISDTDFENGYTGELAPGDKFIVSIDGGEYHIQLLSVYSVDWIEISVSKNDKFSLGMDNDFGPSVKEFEVTEDNYYDISVEFDSATIEPKKATLTIQKIHVEIPEDEDPDYSCIKHYTCPNGTEIQYCQIIDSGCACESDPASLCTDQDECDSDSDCDDGEVFTNDTCSGTPKKCSNELITECKDNDGYCPSACDYDNDNDCPEPDECLKDSDCNDDDISTKDICSGTPKKCSNKKITGCISGDDYCPSDCEFDEDKDCPEPDQCSSDTDCDDNNACTEDSCSGTPKQCSNARISLGCDIDGSCASIGTRSSIQYCSTENELEDQKGIGKDCDNDYECKTRFCLKSKCAKPGFFRSIILWFKRLFGR